MGTLIAIFSSSIFLWIVGVILFVILSKSLLGWVMISDSQNGVVIKKWGLKGSRLPEGKIIALKGEAGIQAKMLEPGLHFFYWWWMYKIEKEDVLTVKNDEIVVIEAIDGAQLPAGAILAKTVVDCNSFQDAKAFLEGGGQKGWQRNHLTAGQYRINPYLFKKLAQPAVVINSDEIGLVTTQDGAPIPVDNIAGKIIEGHSTFQDADSFLNNNGFRGLQEQVILPGKYYINPKFAEIKKDKMVRVEVGYVGVVNSFIGEAGETVTEADFKNGNIVKKGHKGIWEETLDPGLYPVNPRLQDVIVVPTTNIVLTWGADKHETGLDHGLETISLKSVDGFTFDLEVSQVINISSKAAPKVIARFGTVENLISQVLAPTVGNYFRNSAQTSEALEFISGRKKRQEEARKYITKILLKYDVECVDTLIGDIDPPAELMKILSDRKIAEQQQEMYKMQEASEKQRQEFVKAETAATKEKELTGASYDKQIAKETADMAIEQARGVAESKKVNADADAHVLVTVGTAQAKNTLEVGTAEAEVIELKTKAMGQDNFAQVEKITQLAQNKIKLVPEILVQGGEKSGGGSLLDALVGVEILKKGVLKDESAKTESAPAATVTEGSQETSASTQDKKPEKSRKEKSKTEQDTPVAVEEKPQE